METKKERPYVFALDALRLTAILAVLLIHTSSKVIEVSHFNLQAFPLTLFINQIVRFGVPLFFLISGFALELNYENHKNYLSFLLKRFSRVFIPFVIWSAVYYLFIYKNQQSSFLSSLAYGGASYQLYFIPTLLIFYIIFPLLHSIYKFLSNKWTLILLGIIQIILLAYDYYFNPIPLSNPIRITLLSFFVFILGIVASHNQDTILKFVSKWKKVVIPITILLAIYIFFEARTNYLKSFNYLFVYSQWRPSILLYTISLFALLFYLYGKIKNTNLITSLSRLSFFVFFIHIIFLEIVWNTGIQLFDPLNSNIVFQLIFDVAFFTVISSLSFLTAFLLHKIPFLEKILG